MEQFGGTAYLDKIASGTIFYHKKQDYITGPAAVTDPAEESARFEAATEEARNQLQQIYTKAQALVSQSDAAVFEAHMMLLEDESYRNSVNKIIKTQHMNAEYAAARTGACFADMLAGLKDEHMNARAADIKDVTNRIIDILRGYDDTTFQLDKPGILLTEDLSPADLIRMDKTNLLGFVTKEGSPSSHTAILARSLDIPGLCGIDIQKNWDTKKAVIDGRKGILTIEPDETYLKDIKQLQKEETNYQNILEKLKGKSAETTDGRTIHLYANISDSSDIENASASDAEGIGLYRSEFLYIGRDRLPTEEEQYCAYKKAAESMPGKEAIIRTFDIGTDKKADYFNLPAEENPALGCRGIRIALKETETFKTQLRAILRASIYGSLSVMFPMITSVQELHSAKQLLQEAKSDLTKARIPFKDIPVGIMIETPAAVIESEDLAKESDFFSIGTNDLTQYTLAADRLNPYVAEYYNPHHTAILKMIQTTITNAHQAGIQAGICGELAADRTLTESFLKMGADHLSVSPPQILKLRQFIRAL